MSERNLTNFPHLKSHPPPKTSFLSLLVHTTLFLLPCKDDDMSQLFFFPISHSRRWVHITSSSAQPSHPHSAREFTIFFMTMLNDVLFPHLAPKQPFSQFTMNLTYNFWHISSLSNFISSSTLRAQQNISYLLRIVDSVLRRAWIVWNGAKLDQFRSVSWVVCELVH